MASQELDRELADSATQAFSGHLGFLDGHAAIVTFVYRQTGERATYAQTGAPVSRRLVLFLQWRDHD
jgi:hypothetical protein